MKAFDDLTSNPNATRVSSAERLADEPEQDFIAPHPIEHNQAGSQQSQRSITESGETSIVSILMVITLFV